MCPKGLKIYTKILLNLFTHFGIFAKIKINIWLTKTVVDPYNSMESQIDFKVVMRLCIMKFLGLILKRLSSSSLSFSSATTITGRRRLLFPGALGWLRKAIRGQFKDRPKAIKGYIKPMTVWKTGTAHH